MSKIDVLRRIIDECDATLKEAFLRRLDTTNQIAQVKLDDGTPIFDPNREKFVISNVTAGVDVESERYLSTLWKTIMRMSRSKQYDTFIAKNNLTGISYVKNAISEMPVGDFCFGSAIPSLNTAQYPFLAAPIPVQSDDEVYKSLVNNETTYGIIKIKHVNDTEKLYDKLVENHLYVNHMIPLESGQALVIISKNIILDCQNNVTTICFHFPNKHGKLSQCLSIIADRHINIAFLRLSFDESSNTNIVCVDLEANLLDTNLLSAIMQLSDETPFFEIIGTRKPLW